MKNTIEAYSRKWLKSQGHKPESLRIYQLIVHSFFRKIFSYDLKINEVSQEFLVKFLSINPSSGNKYAYNYIQLRSYTLILFFDWAVYNNFCSRNPITPQIKMHLLKRKKFPRRQSPVIEKPECLLETELNELLASCGQIENPFKRVLTLCLINWILNQIPIKELVNFKVSENLPEQIDKSLLHNYLDERQKYANDSQYLFINKLGHPLKYLEIHRLLAPQLKQFNKKRYGINLLQAIYKNVP